MTCERWLLMKTLLGACAIFVFGLVSPAAAQDKAPKKDEQAKIGRLSTLDKCQAIAKTVWGDDLRQIPSTVVDKGVLRHIPYTSFRARRHEINVYGDPEQPCCIEAGIYNESLATEAAKQKCVELIESLLRLPDDRAILRSLNLKEAIKKRAGLTFEVTPSTAEDAYGGWWVSIYDEAACDRSRATPEELKAISIPKRTILERATAKRPAEKEASSDDSDNWSPADLELARPSAPLKAEPTGPGPTTKTEPSPSSSGTVYVRGYVRKDGTYVRPHTRSRPKG
jgi:hypothetical protein